MSTTVSEFRTLSDHVDHALVRSVEELLPMLRGNAADAERLRRLPSAGIEALEALGVTRLTAPRRFGGLQVNAATEFEVVRTIARACGSTSWVMALYALCGYWASLFPDPVQELVFSGPGARVAGVSAPG
ncbi:acyl-CoA dehydrogenase family protein [Streptomyces sp. NPDC020800]|uniref:acyl-CoA dehydrogenase family protein n=1 Tax=Streptomyces sp. NPDC020800 TaxID=3365092 RepID=UPI00378816B7